MNYSILHISRPRDTKKYYWALFKILTLFSFEVERRNPGYPRLLYVYYTYGGQTDLNLCLSFFILLSDGITRICQYSQMTWIFFVVSYFSHLIYLYHVFCLLDFDNFHFIITNLYMYTWNNHTNVSINTILRVDNSICINDNFVETNFLWSYFFLN